jgi:hypothetical protein
LWLALFPIVLLVVVLFSFEALLAIGIRADYLAIKLTLLFVGSVLTGVLAIKVRNLLGVSSSAQTMFISWLDWVASLTVFGVVLSAYVSYHYVTPSASVLYYVFFDYFRFFNDTGLIRPDLPAENPGGTWLSMQTYHPGLSYLTDIFAINSSFESYRESFGLVVGLFYVSALCWLGLVSKRLLNLTFVGVALGATIFFYAPQIGLVQSLIRIGSHDTPILYFTVVLFVLFSFFMQRNSKVLPERTMTVFLLSVAIFLLAVSLRPYLVSLIFIPAVMFAMFVYRNGFNVRRYWNWFSADSVSLLNWVSIGILFAGLYWFVMLIVMYGSPVIYSHTQQLHNVQQLNLGLRQLKVMMGVVMNDWGAGPYVSQLNVWIFYVVLGFATVSAFVYKKINILAFSALCLVLSLASPFLTMSGMHWKSFSPFIIVLYMVLPAFLASYYLALFRKEMVVLVLMVLASLLSYGYVHFNNLLPGSDMQSVMNQDAEFRRSVSDAVTKGEKILVLRGGEPGGDSQSFIPGYYYWDNVFLFGDVDRYIQTNRPDSVELICELEKRNVGYIFNPENIGMRNHSGEEVFGYIKELIENDSDNFIPLVKRKDGYKGIFYRIKDISAERCNRLKRIAAPE